MAAFLLFYRPMRNLFFIFFALLIAGFKPRLAEAATRVNLVSFTQVHTAMNFVSAESISPFPEYLLIWDPRNFESPYRAQLTHDVLLLAVSWDAWINQYGQLVRGFRKKTRVVFVDEPFHPLSDSIRAHDLFRWLEEHVQKNPSLAAHAAEFTNNLPPELSFARNEIQNALATARVPASQRLALEKQIEALIGKALKPKATLSVIASSGTKTCEGIFSAHAILRGI